MAHPELKELTRVEQLFNVGKLDKAFDLLNNSIQFKELNSEQRDYYQFLKGLILLYHYKSEETIKFGEKMFEEASKQNKKLQSLDGIFFILTGLTTAQKFNETFTIIERAEILLENCSTIPKELLIPRKARIALAKAWIYLEIYKIDESEKCVEEILSLRKNFELRNDFELVWANILMARIMSQAKDKFEVAITFTKKAKLLAKDINFYQFWRAFCHLSFGVWHFYNDEYSLSLKHSLKSLALFRKLKNEYFIAMMLNNLGDFYNKIENYDLALKYLHESLLLLEKQSFDLELPLSSLISIALEKNDEELAQKYFNQLEKIYFQKKEGQIILYYQSCKALMLKRSPRIRDRARAEELLKKVIETETIWFEFTIDSLIHLCDLLLDEYRLNNSSDVQDELNHYIAKLLSIAEKQHSYRVFCEVFILKAKLELLNFNIKAARRLFMQAQRIAQSNGIKNLAMKISHEHDDLLRQEKIWEILKESEISFSERWKVAGLKEQMQNMIRKRLVTVPELLDEESITLLIITEGGAPLFTHSFIEEDGFDSPIFSGFLTTIDYFMNEVFSEGLDRFIFGNYTLILKSISPFFICYVFKGESYHALQRINYFIENVQKEEMWQILINLYKTNRYIYLKDIPLLETLITEVFITRSIVTSEF